MSSRVLKMTSILRVLLGIGALLAFLLGLSFLNYNYIMGHRTGALSHLYKRCSSIHAGDSYADTLARMTGYSQYGPDARTGVDHDRVGFYLPENSADVCYVHFSTEKKVIRAEFLAD